MIHCKVSDYMTISLQPGGKDIPCSDLLRKGLEALYLEELWDKGVFEYMCQNKRYYEIYRFEDIQIKLPYADNYNSTGICFEFSGHGLDYYREYLRLHYVGVDLRKVCGRFVALGTKFGYKTTSSRFDVAFDEIVKKGELVDPCLDIDRISDVLTQRAFVSKFRKSDYIPSSGDIKPFFNELDNSENFDKSLSYRFKASRDLCSGSVGKTIELGRRKGASFVRIYDKLVEQQAKGFEVPADYASWIRFEMEFKGKNAASVFFLFATSQSDAEFIAKMRGEAFSLIRFVDLDHSRRYNCSVCDWWLRFLDNAASYVLPYHPPHYNKYIRALRAQKRQNSSSLATLVCCDRKNLKSILLDGVNNTTKTSRAIAADYIAIRHLSPEEFEKLYEEQTRQLTGLEFWQQFYHLEDRSAEEFSAYLEKALEGVCNEALEGIKVS